MNKKETQSMAEMDSTITRSKKEEISQRKITLENPHRIFTAELADFSWEVTIWEKPISRIALDLGISKQKVLKEYESRGFISAVKDLTSQMPPLSLARHFGVTRTVLMKRLDDFGIVYPASQRTKWGRFDIDAEGNKLDKEQSLAMIKDYFLGLIARHGYVNDAPKYEEMEKIDNAFVGAFQNRGFVYNQILRAAGFEPRYDPKKWRFLDVDGRGKALSREETLNLAAGYYKKNVMSDEFRKTNGIGEHESPSYNMMMDCHYEFTRAIYHRGIKLCEVQARAGDEPAYDPEKWLFLDIKPDGMPLTKAERIVAAGEYLGRIISDPTFRVKHGLMSGETPSLKEVLEEHNDLYRALQHRGIQYNEVIFFMGYEPNYVKGKWLFLLHKSDGTPRTKDELLDEAVVFFKEKVFTPAFKAKHGIAEGMAPTAKMINDENMDFFSVLSTNGLTVNDLYKRLGLVLNSDKEKWAFLDYNENGEPLIYREQISILSRYLKTNVLTKEYMKTNRIPEGIAPSIQQLYDAHMDFLGAMGGRGILYSDVVQDAGFPANAASDLQKIGLLYHRVFEQVLLEYTRGRGCASKNEVMIESSSLDIEVRRRRCDIIIHIDAKLKSLSPAVSKFCDEHKDANKLIFDCYLGNSTSTLLDHCTRGYQSEDRFLFLIPTHSSGNDKAPTDIPFPDHVGILNDVGLVEFLGMHGDLAKRLSIATELAIRSLGDDEARSILEGMAHQSTMIIKERFG